jgi:hypothetical protein
MKRTRLIIGGVVVVSAVVGFFAYSAYKTSNQRDALANDLKEFAAAYQAFQEKHSRPPFEGEIEAVIAGKPEPFKQLVRSKDMVVRWGSPIDPKAEGADKKTIAFINRAMGRDKVATLFQNGQVDFLALEEVTKPEREPAKTKTAKEEPKKP